MERVSSANRLEDVLKVLMAGCNVKAATTNGMRNATIGE
jgi:hypothetical protein